MSKMTPREMAARIGGGLLSFPVTPFKPDYSFDEATYRANMDWLCGYDLIINTVPARVLGQEDLEDVNPSCLILDLAS